MPNVFGIACSDCHLLIQGEDLLTFENRMRAHEANHRVLDHEEGKHVPPNDDPVNCNLCQSEAEAREEDRLML